MTQSLPVCRISTLPPPCVPSGHGGVQRTITRRIKMERPRTVTLACAVCAVSFTIPQCHIKRYKCCGAQCGQIYRKRNCIEYQGISFSLNHSSGYYFNTRKKLLLHRVMWQSVNGPIPEGYDIHHVNGNKTDNRHENFELIHHASHARHHNFERHAKRRASGIAGSEKCKRGHRFTDKTTKSGKRKCWICSRMKERERWAKRKQEQP